MRKIWLAEVLKDYNLIHHVVANVKTELEQMAPDQDIIITLLVYV